MTDCPCCKGNVPPSRAKFVEEVLTNEKYFKLYYEKKWTYEDYCKREGIEPEAL